MQQQAKDSALLVALVRAAETDPTLRKQLITLLSLPPIHRTPFLHTLIQDASLRQMPQEFIDALSSLLSHNVSQATLDFLRQALDTRPFSKRRLYTYWITGIVVAAIIAGMAVMFDSSFRRSTIPEPPQRAVAPAQATNEASIFNLRPVYPLKSRLNNEEGTVLLLVTLSSSGTVENAIVEKSSGHANLDQAALGSVKLARFSEAAGTGTTMRLPIRFKLREQP
ncbi:MAG: hypothetical protein C0404_12540 [Verrucomicrobia bacterium]|nr:hypothetical protein [Verrucomicrobiota bacterium]